MPCRWSSNWSKLCRALNQALCFSQPKYLSKVIFHPWSAYFIIYFRFESVFCEVFFKSVQWVTKKNLAAALCFHAKEDLFANSWVQHPGQPVVTNSGFLQMSTLKSLVKSSPAITAVAGEIESPIAQQRRYLWLNVIFHVFSWNQLWHLLHVCGQERWQQYWRGSTVSLSKASAAVLFGKESLVPERGRKSAENTFLLFEQAAPGPRLFCSPHFTLFTDNHLIPFNYQQKLSVGQQSFLN